MIQQQCPLYAAKAKEILVCESIDFLFVHLCSVCCEIGPFLSPRILHYYYLNILADLPPNSLHISAYFAFSVLTMILKVKNGTYNLRQWSF